MNKNVHFVNTNEYYNEEFKIYDITYLSDKIILSSDIIGQLIYYEIENDDNNNFNIKKKEVNQIYPIDDLDNLISIYSIDTFNNEDIILGSSKAEVIHLKNNKITEKYINLKSDKFSKVKYISENLFAAGDFKGNITLFDVRQKSHIKIFKEQTEEITDILYDPNKPNFLLTSSIDSTLCVYDINKLSLYALSDKLDEELNCLMSYKNGNYILCGSGEGNVLIFNWDWFGDFKDMIKGHPEGINDMVKYNENIFFTGAEDGLIRICTMYPKGIRGVLKNKNKKKENSVIKDVNKIKMNKDKTNLATCNGIDCLRIYDISQIEFNKLYKPIDEFDFEEKDNNETEHREKKIKEKEKNKESDEENDEESESNKEFNEMEDEEEEEDDNEEQEIEGEEEDDDNNGEEENEEKSNGIKDKEIKKEKGKNILENDNTEDPNKLKLLNKKRKKEESDSEKEEKSNKKEESSKNSDSESSSESDSDSSSTRKKNKKKVKKIGKKTKSLIAKEERKAFFNDL